MERKGKTAVGVICLVLTVALVCGCTKKAEFGEEYNYNTDYQYSYCTSIMDWQKVQSDGAGQYIIKNAYIYYHNTKTDKLAPLCSKANCLHDMESDRQRIGDCNACIVDSEKLFGWDAKFIQYYDGNVYYVIDGSLYRVNGDGSRKDKIFTAYTGDEELPIVDWCISRGRFYYGTQPYFYGQDKSTQIYQRAVLKVVDMFSRMSEKNAEVLFDSGEGRSAFNLNFTNYKNYMVYQVLSNEKDFEMTSNESWIKQVHVDTYLYNTETGEKKEIPVPEGFSETTGISSVVFLEDRVLIKLYDDLQDEEYKLPVYSMTYDLKDLKVWLDDVEQGCFLQSYDNHVIITDAGIQYFLKENEEFSNIEIYSSNGERLSWFVYPMNVKGTFGGFGPDGINIEFKQNDTEWSIYELKFDDVLHCKGEKVKPRLIGQRKFGSVNKEIE